VRDGPDFDELVGGEPEGAERERLRRVHELLVAAGPPPEMTPEIESGPTLAMTLSRQRKPRRRLALLAAAAVAVGLVFLGGYLVGSSGSGSSTTFVRTIDLRGTSAAPNALASLQLEPGDAAGNWPMKLSVSGLPALPPRAYYAVYLVRKGEPWAPCGWFVAGGAHSGTTVILNAPYELRNGDTWVVTRQVEGSSSPGQPVLRPVA
jgi:hypothetical protein